MNWPFIELTGTSDQVLLCSVVDPEAPHKNLHNTTVPLLVKPSVRTPRPVGRAAERLRLREHVVERNVSGKYLVATETRTAEREPHYLIEGDSWLSSSSVLSKR